MGCIGRKILEHYETGECLVVDAVYAQDTFDPPHQHGMSQVSVVLHGASVEVCDSVPHVHRKNTATACAAVQHALYFPVETRVFTIELQESTLPSRRTAQIVRAEEIVRSRDRIKELAKSLVVVSPSTSAPPQWLRQSVETFHWDGRSPLRDAARIAHVSHSQYDRAFRRHFGAAPRQHRALARLRHASRLLLTSSRPIAEVAVEAGFYDQSHLTAAFKRALGLTPARFRGVFTRKSS